VDQNRPKGDKDPTLVGVWVRGHGMSVLAHIRDKLANHTTCAGACLPDRATLLVQILRARVSFGAARAFLVGVVVHGSRAPLRVVQQARTCRGAVLLAETGRELPALLEERDQVTATHEPDLAEALCRQAVAVDPAMDHLLVGLESGVVSDLAA
jgi:hypothetical protein